MTRVRPRRDGFRGLAAALVLTFCCAAAAHAETRVALVIGNGDYKNTSRLANPRNDATDIAAALTRAGFETITGFDLDRAGMEDAESRFARKARDADVALFYYSGHAIQYAGTNYLLPVDATIRDSTDLRRLAKVDDIVDDLQLAKTLRVLILDSCRDNPLADELKRALGSSRGASVQRGLARLDSPRGMIVAYSTQAGQTADDGGGRNSPYTAALLRQIETPEEISVVFKRTAAEVARSGRQLPELSLSFFGDFYLKGPAQAVVIPPTSKPAVPSDAPVKEARLPDPSDPLDLVTDCDRLASNPSDPQRPRGVAGVLVDKIDFVPALAACNSAMAQHAEIARFTFQAGRIANAQNDYAGARPLYEKAAGMGSGAAMYSLGMVYFLGRGAPLDYAEARKWFEKAAAAGFGAANELVGMLYRDGRGVTQDYGEARKWFEKGVAAGSPDAMVLIAVLYELGEGVAQNYGEARKLYEKAADAGSSGAMIRLAVLYRAGKGVTQDDGEAGKWLEKAANAGPSMAMVNIGDMYLFGQDFPKDYSVAKSWYEKAAAANNHSALVRLGDVYFYEAGKMQDYAEARKWYQKAADAGETSGMDQLGVIYRRGYGVYPNIADAINWYEKSAAAGSPVAMNALGEMTLDSTKATQWYEKAAAAGSRDAMLNLAKQYENGMGVAKDRDAARKWYRTAANAGNQPAKDSLARMDAEDTKAKGGR